MAKREDLTGKVAIVTGAGSGIGEACAVMLATRGASVVLAVESLGFRPIDAGPLAMSRALERMGVLNISLNMKNSWPWQTGWKLLGPTGGTRI